MNIKCKVIALVIVSSFMWTLVNAQEAKLYNEKVSFRTYGYSDPNPIVDMNKIYPYFKFEGYEKEGKQKEWEIIVLENEFIKVLVAPEIGGKVLGAIEKSTGNEFLYYNKVVKFRDIASRGPWTSGGIEFNFGSIGHTPMVSSPVDYFTRKNEDGSVSCFIGASDLASRTKWTVEIRLPKDRAYFETRGFWHNSSDLETSLYHWSNAAAEVSDDLQFFYPGTHHIFHDGLKYSYPINENGTDISHYGNIKFGGDKSQHVIGKYTDAFGGYWENKDFGFVHWVDYTEKPGKKKFMWSASRQGEIWKDLLTDADLGNKQYMEYQSGFMFNQASPGSEKTPYKHVSLLPNVSESFTEAWFPVLATGGISKANTYGTIHAFIRNGFVVYKFCPLREINEELIVKVGDEVVLTKKLDLKPLHTFADSVRISDNRSFEITIGDNLIRYSTKDEKDRILKRPIETPAFNWETAFGYYTSGEEWASQRYFDKAFNDFEKSLTIDPYFVPALEDLAELYYKKMDYGKAIEYSKRALEIDTYSAKANYIFGLVMLQNNDYYNALDAFGLASKDLRYRALSYLKIAQLYIEKGAFEKATLFAGKSLQYNADSETANYILLIGNRLLGNTELAITMANNLLAKNPLNHLARIERVFCNTDLYSIENVSNTIQNEFARETWLEMAITYSKIGRNTEALILLENAPESVLNNLWLAEFYRIAGKKDQADSVEQKVLDASPQFVFPFRAETFELLIKVAEGNENWKLKYYMALILWSKNQTDEAIKLFRNLGDEPDFAPFYLTKAKLFLGTENYSAEADLLKAKSIDSNSWRTSKALIAYYRQNNRIPEALNEAKKSVDKFKDNFLIEYDYARCLIENEQFKSCLDILNEITILPAEGARSGRTTYRQACIILAIQHYQKKQYKTALSYVEKARLYPENLGAGRPYDVDERIEDYIQASCLFKRNMTQEANEALNRIEAFTLSYNESGSSDYVSMLSFDYMYVLTLKKMGRENEIESFLNQWKEKSGNSLSYQWAVAMINKDDSKVSLLETEIIGKGNSILSPDGITPAIVLSRKVASAME